MIDIEDIQYEAEYESEDRCQTCLGDSFVECDGDCADSDDCGCPYGGNHFIRCWNCGGSGKAKDQRFW